MTAPLRSVAVLGLGLLGRPVARRLADRGFGVVGWNRSALAADLVSGIPLVPTLEAAARADAHVLVLADSDAVTDVLHGLRPSLSPGALVVDLGSSEPWQSEEHARTLGATGIGWVDAPVSGGPEGAAAGTLAIMAGGVAADVARARPLLEALGGSVVHVGGPGAGHTAKLANQAIVGVLVEAVAEALALAERAGLDPWLAIEAMRGGSADTRVTRVMGGRMASRDYAPRAHVTTILKDLRTARELGRRVGVELPCVEQAIVESERLVGAGGARLDVSALHLLRLGVTPDALS